MPAMPDPTPPRRSSYELVQEQLANLTEERIEANITRIKRTIGLYERIYGMSSSEMRRRVAAGEMDETNEICEWSEYLDLVARFHGKDPHDGG